MKKFTFFFIFLFTFIGNLHSYEYSVAIAAIFKNEAPYLREWVEYHKMIGVEHFWLYNDNSSDNFEEILEPYIEEGLVEIIDWPVPKGHHFVGYQCAAYRDALFNAKGIAKWVALIDIDEFILPMRDKTIKECLENRFKNASAIYATWLVFGTSKVTIPAGESILFKLFKCSEKSYKENFIGKTIIKPEDADEECLWYPHFCQLKKGKYCYGDGERLTLERKDKKLKDLKIKAKTHCKYIRINHYYFRDESFFKNSRMKKVRNLNYLNTKYKLCSKSEDHKIMKFIKQNYKEMYENFWKEE